MTPLKKNKKIKVVKTEAEIRQEKTHQYYQANADLLKTIDVTLERIIHYDDNLDLLFVKDAKDDSRFVSYEKNGNRFSAFGIGERSPSII